MRRTRSDAREVSPDAGLGAVTIAIVFGRHAGPIAATTAVMFIHEVRGGATGANFIR